MIGPFGYPEDLLLVSGIQTSVGRQTHSQLTHLRFHPLGHYWYWFPLSPKRETEKWHFSRLVTVTFYNAKTSFLDPSFQNCAYTETRCIYFTVPRRWIVHSGEAWEQCPEEAEERVFYRHCAVRSADMQTWVCISFLLFSPSYELHFPAEWGKVKVEVSWQLNVHLRG